MDRYHNYRALQVTFFQKDLIAGTAAVKFLTSLYQLLSPQATFLVLPGASVCTDRDAKRGGQGASLGAGLAWWQAGRSTLSNLYFLSAMGFLT